MTNSPPPTTTASQEDPQEWVRSSKWAPAHAGGGSQGFSVECPATGELGHGKPMSIAQEVLASRFADKVEVPVPQTTLGKCEEKIIAVSKLWGSKSLDVPLLRAQYPQDCASDAFKEGLRGASGLVPFHAWIGTGDHKDEHVMARPGPTQGVYEFACIDFASAFGWGAPGEPVAVPPGPPVFNMPDHLDRVTMEKTVSRIETVSNEDIAKIVNSIPRDLLSEGDAHRIQDGLISRKNFVRATFNAAGLLPALS